MRTKAKILKVGTVEQREDGLTVVRDWHMDFADCDAVLRAEPVQRDEDGAVVSIGNFTLDELGVIAAEHRVVGVVQLEEERPVDPGARLGVVGRAAGHLAAGVFVLCLAVATPLLLGLAAGAFWRAFRWVQGW